jgi:hypothetical protein
VALRIDHWIDRSIDRCAYLEAIGIAALLLAHLAVPSKTLQAFGLDAIGNGLGCKELVLAHGDAVTQSEVVERRSRKWWWWWWWW